MKKDTIHRIDLIEGNFAFIAREALLNQQLTEPAFRLLVCALNNADKWDINMYFFGKRLKWSNDKIANAIGVLVKLGYVQRTEKRTGGGGKGSGTGSHLKTQYRYIINEVPSSSLILEVQPLKSKASSQKLEVKKSDTDKNNIDNINRDNINKEKNNVMNEVTPKIGGKEIPVESQQKSFTHSFSETGEIKKIDFNGIKINEHNQDEFQKHIAAMFVSRESDFSSSNKNLKTNFQGFFKKLIDRNYLNSSGGIESDWNGYITRIIKGIVEGKYDFTHSTGSGASDKQSFNKSKSPSTKKVARCPLSSEAEIQDLVRFIEVRLSQDHQKDAFNEGDVKSELAVWLINDTSYKRAIDIVTSVFNSLTCPMPEDLIEASNLANGRNARAGL